MNNRLGYLLKTILIFLFTSACTTLQAEVLRNITNDSLAFKGSYWIGAITRKNSRLPQGRNYTGAKLKNAEVKSAWDNVDSLAKRSIILRKEFSADKGLKKAVAFVCGLGFYEFSLNGKKVGDAEFAPLWSDYDKSVFFNVYDVTSAIKKGNNAIGILLGNGFYNVNGGRYRKLQISFGPPTLRLVIKLEYGNGDVRYVASDSSWKYSLSPITFNCIYGGEDYDARLEQKGWDNINFNEAGWKNVVIQEAPKGIMRRQLGEPVKIMEYYSPLKSHRLSYQERMAACKSMKRLVDSTAVVFDMGQNLSGFPEIEVSGKRGDVITLIPGESLTDEGAVSQRQTGRQHYYQYTLKGTGKEKWHPRFSYYGFRYIQVEGIKESSIHSIKSCFVYDSAPKVSSFECSNEIFNATHRIIEKAVRSNMQGVFTDCPHREKLGWLEEVHLNGPGLLYNYDLRRYGAQIMQNMADAQHPDGAMPTTAPEYVYFEGPGMDDFAQSPEWGASLVVFPFMYYERYGDDSLIKRYMPNMIRYIDYLSSRAENGILSFGLGDWYDYGDFRAGFSRNTPVPLVATAHFYMMLKYMVVGAGMLNDSALQSRYEKMADFVRESFNDRFYNHSTHQYGSGSQCSNSLPLFLEMVPEGDKGKVLDNLVNDIKFHNYRLTTGDVGNRYLFQVLARNGLNDIMYRMHNHYDAPGYGFQLKFGATTLTEQWDPRQGSSWNHFMMGQIDEWFFNSLAGFREYSSSLDGWDILSGADPQKNKIVIAPQPVDNLTFVKASTMTLCGEVKIYWKNNDKEFKMNLCIPKGITAYVYMPGDRTPRIVNGGKHNFINKKQ